MIRYIAFFSFLLLAASIWAGQFDDAMVDFEDGRYPVSRSVFENLAEQGHPQAQYMLGYMYSTGQGGIGDDVQAYKWFSLAAEKGVSEAWEAKDDLARRMSPEEIENGRRLAQDWRPRPEVLPPPERFPERPMAPRDEDLSFPQIREVQGRLNALGYDPGPADGVPGRRTRIAIHRFQRDHDLHVDGRLSHDLLRQLRNLTPNLHRPPSAPRPWPHHPSWRPHPRP